MITSLRPFLSSTSVDLHLTRQEIRRFLEILASDVIAMEIFGSDEATPKDVSLERVRQSNVFIGVYAHRYGAVDPETGRSITEWEYREAAEMLARGELIGLLVYVISDKAEWPFHLIELDPEAQTKLRAFKDEVLANHTATIFSEVQQLPLQVLRDALRKVGVTARPIFEPRTPAPTTERRHLERPIGMEYYTVDLASFFWGRDAGPRGGAKNRRPRFRGFLGGNSRRVQP